MTGAADFVTLDELDEAEFDRTLRVNFKSAFLCTQAVLPAMRARRWGRIVNLSSVAARPVAKVPRPGYSRRRAHRTVERRRDTEC